MRLRAIALGLAVTLSLTMASGPAVAVEAPPGTANFTPPAYVPDYFSNESGRQRGGADARAAQSDGEPVAEAPAPRSRAASLSRRGGRHHAAHAGRTKGHLRLAHGKTHATRQVAHAGAAHSGKKPLSRLAHTEPRRATGKSAAAKTPVASSKGKHIAAAHG